MLLFLSFPAGALVRVLVFMFVFILLVVLLVVALVVLVIVSLLCLCTNDSAGSGRVSKRKIKAE